MAGTSWDKLGQMDADFARQAGGEAVVDVAWQEDRPEAYTVSAAWWLDDYDTATRRSRQETVGTFTRDRSLDDLEALLLEALRRIDGWTEADLDQRSGPHPDWQRYQSRDEFYRTRLPRR